jgi:glycosyltransferase involved in cell wall biosynthesis
MLALAYDARYITAEPTGIGQLCLALLEGFARLPECPRLKVLVLHDITLPANIAEAPHLEVYRVPWEPYSLRNQLRLGALLRQCGVRLLHGMDCFNPVLIRGVGLLVTVHDVIPLTCASFLRRSKKARLRRLWQTWLRLQCARAAAVSTVSHHSATDIARFLGVPPQKIHIIHNPVRAWGAIESVATFRRRWGLDGRIISYVGRHDPYKNILGLIRAMAMLRHLYGGPLQLVIAGHLNLRYPEAYEEVYRLGLTDKVVFCGYLNDASLGALYKASDVFVCPSFYEGFGMPPIEAMSFGIPVVASNRTALPEVLGNAALFMDPANPQAMAEMIMRVLCQPCLARQLREAGLQRAATFSRQRAAQQYVDLYRQLLARQA